MIVFSVMWVLLVVAVAIYPVRALRHYQRTTWWDYVYPFTGIIAWFPLGMSNIGSTVSMSNFVVELFWIAVFSIVIPWVRWLLSRIESRQGKTVSVILTFVPLVTAVVLRLMMPTLPE